LPVHLEIAAQIILVGRTTNSPVRSAVTTNVGFLAKRLSMLMTAAGGLLSDAFFGTPQSAGLGPNGHLSPFVVAGEMSSVKSLFSDFGSQPE
jgi:hypothetical protein